MQQYLYLARHAHADDEAASDALRPLSPKGRQQLQRLTDGLVGTHLLRAETIWQSGLLRAQQTAEGLNHGLGLNAPIERVGGLAPYDDPKSILTSINKLSTNCLITGHEPNLSALASLLLVGSDQFQRIVFTKASILCLSRTKIGAEATPWQIEWHVSHHFYK